MQFYKVNTIGNGVKLSFILSSYLAPIKYDRDQRPGPDGRKLSAAAAAWSTMPKHFVDEFYDNHSHVEITRLLLQLPLLSPQLRD